MSDSLATPEEHMKLLQERLVGDKVGLDKMVKWVVNGLNH